MPAKNSSRNNRIGLIVFAVVVLAPSYVTASECEPRGDLSDRWQLASQDVHVLKDKLGEPQLVSFDTGMPSNGDGEFEVTGHMHALFDTPFQGFVRALDEIEGQAEFLPRLEVTDVICSDRPADGYVRVRHELSFRFIVFQKDYRYVIDSFIENEVESSGTYRVWWEMHDPEDGQIVKNSGSWYVSRVEVEGRELTYVAAAVHVVFAERQVGLPFAVRAFGTHDARDAIIALRDEAQELARRDATRNH